MLLTFSSLVKNQDNAITLDSDVLADLFSPLDEYFGDPENIAICSVQLKSAQGNQQKSLRFDLTETLSPVDVINVSSRSRANFIITKITVTSYDGESLSLSQNDLASSDAIPTLSFNGTAET